MRVKGFDVPKDPHGMIEAIRNFVPLNSELVGIFPAPEEAHLWDRVSFIFSNVQFEDVPEGGVIPHIKIG